MVLVNHAIFKLNRSLYDSEQVHSLLSIVDIPHYGGKDWNWVKGAFCTVDRPYPYIIDMLHHHIGTTHVLHHVCSQIPHYHAKEASRALYEAYPHLCKRDLTPVHIALWRVAKNCAVVGKFGKAHFYVEAKDATDNSSKNTTK